MNPTTVELISGLSAGFCTTLVTHPLDIIKVRLQLSDSSLSSIVKNLHGSYYRGIMPNLIGNISAWGLYFALYSEFKSIMPAHSTAANYFSSSVLAGLSTSVLTNPIWVLKTRILGTTYAYTSMLDAIKQMLRKEGVTSFWKGTIPSMFQVFQASLQITIYDHFTRYDDLSTLYALATSKIISMVVMYPAQVGSAPTY
ncbi:Mitochondrial FAD carrier protein FLX1 [Candida viswanathii]|uniref:Mitochondrial thiamine pyrophosphate carrier 1 n=1 Tax=Candida viswanathii TaxID=5486 RepID=A0A367YIP3_9ASCO|nr:Mitochondrial FAD carrier protein FLX1 [Candida viswanathii]